MLALGRQVDIFKRNTRWHFFYLERLTGRIFGPWSAGTAWRVLHVLEALAFSQGSLSPVLNISVHFCAGMLPQSKPLVHKSPVPVQNELWSSCSTIRASVACITALHFCTSGRAARHRCLGAACKVFQVAQSKKPTHFAYLSQHKLKTAFISYFFLFFKAAQKSSCCSFRSDLLSQLHVHFQLESNLTFDLEIGVKRRKVNLLRILLQEKLKTLSSCFYLDLLQTATNWTRKRELTSCMKNNFTLLAHEISL